MRVLIAQIAEKLSHALHLRQSLCQ